MTSIEQARLLIAAVALLWLAGCGMLPQRGDEPAVTEDAAGGVQSRVETVIYVATPDSDRVRTINPHTQGRKAVSAAAQQRFTAAVASMRVEDWVTAEHHLTWLNNEYPGYSGPFLNLGIVYRQQGKLAAAEEAFGKAIVANRANLDAYNQLAILYREQGRFRDAEMKYQAALAVWPEHADTHRNLGILYELYMGRLERALGHYQQYQHVTLEPDRTVTGWIVDLERRLDRLAAN